MATAVVTADTASSALRGAALRRAPHSPTRDQRAPLTVGALVVAAFFIAFGALHYGFWTRNLLMDTPIYERYGDAIVHGSKLPYRDFGVEYPPGALPVFAAPSLGARPGDFPRYRELFETLMLLCGGVASALVGVVLARRRASVPRLAAGTLLAGLSPLALGPVVLSRFDLWPAMLTIAGLAALVVGDRRRLAAALLGTAVAAKLYPGVVVPLAILYVWRRSGRREAVVFASIASGVALAWFIPFLVLAPHGVWASLSGQASRPLQIESLGASMLLAAHQVWGLPLNEVSSHGSDNLAGHLPHLLAVVQALLAPLAIAGTWVAFARGPATRDRLLRYAAAAVCAFIIFSKVLSPQYLIWLVPLVPLVRGRRGAVASGLFLAAMILTQLWFPQRYLDLAYGFDARAAWLVLARDLVLLALLCALVWPFVRARRAGVSLVLVLVLLAAAAAGAGAARLASPSSLSHSALLQETGIASTCARAKQVPATGAGTVRYALSGYENTSDRTQCATVVVRARGTVFSAAYLGGFEPAHVDRFYLGDSGLCTHVPGVTGSTLRYAFRVPAHARFVVEVEQCDSTRHAPRYTLQLRRTPLR
jgi:hypothetical protein